MAAAARSYAKALTAAGVPPAAAAGAADAVAAAVTEAVARSTEQRELDSLRVLCVLPADEIEATAGGGPPTGVPGAAGSGGALNCGAADATGITDDAAAKPPNEYTSGCPEEDASQTAIDPRD